MSAVTKDIPMRSKGDEVLYGPPGFLFAMCIGAMVMAAVLVTIIDMI